MHDFGVLHIFLYRKSHISQLIKYLRRMIDVYDPLLPQRTPRRHITMIKRHRLHGPGPAPRTETGQTRRQKLSAAQHGGRVESWTQ